MHESCNPSLANSIGADYDMFILTTGGCSCDLFRRAGNGEDDEQSRIDKLRKKYAKKGWSEAKIRRAIGSRRRDGSRDFVGFRDDVRELLARIAGTAGRIGIVVHFYNGLVDEEKIAIGSVQSMTADDFRDCTEVVPEDTLVWVLS